MLTTRSQGGVLLRHDESAKLVLCYNDWNVSSCDPFYRSCHSVVFKTDDAGVRLAMHSMSSVYDDVRDKYGVDFFEPLFADHEITAWESFEGTMINVYSVDGEWRVSTTKCLDVNKSCFGSDMSHGQMLDEIIAHDQLLGLLDPGMTYHFILVHPTGSYLAKYDERDDLPKGGFLVHTLTRDAETFEEVYTRLDHPAIVYAERRSLASFEELKEYFGEVDRKAAKHLDHTDREGVMVCVGSSSRLYKLRVSHYKELQYVIPNCHTHIERLIKCYQTYTIDEHIRVMRSDPALKKLVHEAFTGLSMFMFAAYMHFTEYDVSSRRYTKVNKPDFDEYIKGKRTISLHIARLQELTRRYNGELTLDNVRRHVHNDKYTSSDDVLALLCEVKALSAKFVAKLVGRDAKYLLANAARIADLATIGKKMA